MADPGLAMAVAAALILLGVVASKVSDRLGVPALLLFLAIGMLAGSEGIGRIAFDDFEVAQTVGVIALAFILFAGGLDTEWSSVRPVLRQAVLLATLGVLGTAVITGLAASWLFGVALVPGLLLGSIVSSTDAAAVFAVLRSKNVRLKARLRPLLELESGSNDPMAVFLTVGFIELYTAPDTAVLELVPLFVTQMAVGGAIGYVAAVGSVAAFNRLRLGYEGLYPVALIAVVLLTYGIAALLGGSGFLAVYVAGIAIGHARLVHKNSLVRFADGLAWLMQITMFLVLGLLVFPSELWPVAGRGLLISAALILVARPIATITLLGLTRFDMRETLLVAWVGLRGAVPIVLATFPLVEGIPQGEVIFNVVFFVVITSVLVQGTTIPVVARRLGVAAPLEPGPAQGRGRVEPEGGAADVHEIIVPEGSPAAGRRLVDLDLPRGALVVLVTRDGESRVPQGSTVLKPGDTVLLVAGGDSLPRARRLIQGRA
ncbi:MAG: potassium/proton antiporter [Actinomycetota bacterium]|nr:potassium/proton antiporter [Actinomycetota bacterium]